MEASLLLLVVCAAPVEVTRPSTTPPAAVWTLRDGNRDVVFQRDDVGRDRDGLMAVTVTAGRLTAPAWVGPGLLVRLRAGVAVAPETWTALGVTWERVLSPRLGIHLVHDSGGKNGLDAARRLQSHPLLGGVYPDTHLEKKLLFTGAPNDPRYGGQWYLERMRMEDAWALHQGSTDVTIVVNDNGCDVVHPDLVDNMDEGLNALTGMPGPDYTPNNNGNEHGTACAGLVAARADNSIGMAGVCPNCRVRCVRILSDNGVTPLSTDVAAFNFAIDVNAAVVSNSWGFVNAQPVPAMLRDALELAHDAPRNGLGALILFASGNDDREVTADELFGVRGVITVGASNQFDEATSFTNFGEPVDLVAPTGTLSADISGADGADPGDYTNNFGGTSSACPVAAGVAALMVSAAPAKSAAELTELLVHAVKRAPYATPDATGHDVIYGFGILDPARALRSALGLPEPTDGGMVTQPPTTPPDEPPQSCLGCAGASGASNVVLLGLGLMLLRRRRAVP